VRGEDSPDRGTQGGETGGGIFGAGMARVWYRIFLAYRPGRRRFSFRDIDA